jgi:acetyl-CoA C-acetyltransferase
MAPPVFIASAVRTPMGAFQGDFSGLAAHDLGAAAIRAAVTRSGVRGDAIGEVLMGNCLMAGQGQAPARQPAIKAGLPKSTGAVTLSKMCGSGMKAVMFAHDLLLAGSHRAMVAGAWRA